MGGANTESFSEQGEWTDLGAAEPRFVSGQALEALAGFVQSLLVHGDYLAAYGLSPGDFPGEGRQTRKVSERLAAFRETGGKRQLGTCRDYALLLCGFLRDQGRAARLRCGFADYLTPGRWEDHWVCEYHAEREDGWRLADAQLDPVLRDWLAIDFDHLDLPPGKFLNGQEAWRAWRGGAMESALFGHGEEAGGERFLLLNLVRDHLALSGEEVSAWDRWREALPWDERLTGEERTEGDSLAAGDSICPRPFWWR